MLACGVSFAHAIDSFTRHRCCYLRDWAEVARRRRRFVFRDASVQQQTDGGRRAGNEAARVKRDRAKDRDKLREDDGERKGTFICNVRSEVGVPT